MCLGVPGEVVGEERRDESGLRYILVKIGGVVRIVLVAFDEEVKPGDYVIVHAGIAISKINKEEALETMSLLEEVYDAGGKIA